jgi:hypothetical protein
MGLAPIEGHRPGNAVATQRLGEDARGRPAVAQPGGTRLTGVEERRDSCQVPSESSWCVKR